MTSASKTLVFAVMVAFLLGAVAGALVMSARHKKAQDETGSGPLQPQARKDDQSIPDESAPAAERGVAELQEELTALRTELEKEREKSGELEEEVTLLRGAQPGGPQLPEEWRKLLGDHAAVFEKYLAEIDWKKLGEMSWKFTQMEEEDSEYDVDFFNDPEIMSMWTGLMKTMADMRAELGAAKMQEAMAVMSMLINSSFLDAADNPLTEAQRQAMTELLEKSFRKPGAPSTVPPEERLALDDLIQNTGRMTEFQVEVPGLLSANQNELIQKSEHMNMAEMFWWGDRDWVWGGSAEEVAGEVSNRWMKRFGLEDYQKPRTEQVAQEYAQAIQAIEERYPEEERTNNPQLSAQYEAEKMKAQADAQRSLLRRLTLTPQQREKIIKSEVVLSTGIYDSSRWEESVPVEEDTGD